MATEVEIFNYKTIKHVKFAIDGYTILLGKNYIGKSALITAVVAALTNKAGDSFIRHGEKYAEVRITHGKHQVIWHKEAKNSYYLISDGTNTREYKKIGKSDIPQEIKDMGFGPIEVGGKKNLLWYARQLEVLFLIDKPKQGATTDLIASVTNLDTVYKAVDLAKKDLKGAKSSLKIRQADLAAKRKEAEAYLPLDEYNESSEDLDSLTTSAQGLTADVTFIDKVSEELGDNTITLKKYHPVTQLEDIPVDVQSGMIRDLTTLITLIESYENSSGWYESKKGTYEKLVTCETGEDLLKKASENVQKVRAVAILESKYKQACDAFAAFEGISKLVPIEDKVEKAGSLVASIQNINVINNKYEKLILDLKGLEHLKDFPEVNLDPKKVEELKKIKDSQVKLDEAVAQLKKDHKEVLELTEAQKELDEKLAEFKTCEACGALL